MLVHHAPTCIFSLTARYAAMLVHHAPTCIFSLRVRHAAMLVQHAPTCIFSLTARHAAMLVHHAPSCIFSLTAQHATMLVHHAPTCILIDSAACGHVGSPCTFLYILIERAACGHVGSPCTYLYILIESAEHVIDLVLEPTREHLISFIQHKHLDVADIWQHKTDRCECSTERWHLHRYTQYQTLFANFGLSRSVYYTIIPYTDTRVMASLHTQYQALIANFVDCHDLRTLQTTEPWYWRHCTYGIRHWVLTLD